MIYELRTYVTTPDRLEKLHRRFADKTLPIFTRLSIEVVAFFTDRDDPTRLIYLTRFDDEQDRSRAWEAFANDEEWLQVKQDSEDDGPLVVDRESIILQPTTYSPVS